MLVLASQECLKAGQSTLHKTSKKEKKLVLSYKHKVLHGKQRVLSLIDDRFI